MIPIAAADPEWIRTLDVKAFTRELSANYYPPLFLLLNQLEFVLCTSDATRATEKLLALQSQMAEDMNTLYHKEKKELFPLLLQLEESGKKSEDCKPFKRAKFYYTHLMAALQQCKQLLAGESASKSNQDPAIAAQLVSELEQGLIKLQLCKERYLFKPFRSCSGNCQSMEL